MKKMTLAILALVLVTVTTAFTSQHNNDAAKKDATDYAYFEYTGSGASGENDPSNWREVSGPLEACSGGGEVLCVIQAPMAANGTQPDFTGISNIRNSSLVPFISFKQ